MKYILMGMIWAVATIAVAQDHSKSLEKYLTDDVIAIAYFDLSQVDTLGALECVEKLGLGPAAENRGLAVQMLLSVQKKLDQLADSGARYVYVLFHVSDVYQGGPTWVLPIAGQSGRDAIFEWIVEYRPDVNAALRNLRLNLLPARFENVEGAVLGANSAEQLEQLQSKRPINKRDLVIAWKALGQGHCGLLIIGDKDSRRVVREMFPTFPEPFQAIDGKLLADRLHWGGIVAHFRPEPRLQLVIQTDQKSSAAVLQQCVSDGLALLNQFPFDEQVLSSDDRDAFAKAVVPRVTESLLIISFDDLLSDRDRIAHLLKPRVESARQAARDAQRKNQFRQILLGMLNYESANGKYPPRGTYAGDGKPQLSWRVHVLPYLGEEELALYKQFHLDEPWDSEHNRPLITLMPAIYADPDPDPVLSKRNAAGRTTYLVPTGEGTAFAGSEGRLLKDITDGTSNTLALVEVAALSAPFWTRPTDWLVDLNNPWERLSRDERDFFTAGFCDGSVYTISFSTPVDKLRAWLSIAGGEVEEHP